MRKETVKIKNGVKTERELYNAYVEYLRPVFKLAPRESSIFAELLYYNNEKRDIPEEDRFQLIFSTSYRKKIEAELGLKGNTLANSLSILRSKGLVIDNKIPRQYLVYTDTGKLQIILNLYVVEEKTEKTND